jgi:hypothetical protein
MARAALRGGPRRLAPAGQTFDRPQNPLDKPDGRVSSAELDPAERLRVDACPSGDLNLLEPGRLAARAELFADGHVGELDRVYFGGFVGHDVSMGNLDLEVKPHLCILS